MAAATISKTSFGYYVTGGTSATDVTTGKVWVKSMIFIPATANDTLTLLDTKTGAAIFSTLGPTAGVATVFSVGGEKGICYEGINATLSGANDKLYINVA